MDKENQIVIYESEEGKTIVSVKLHDQTVWLTLNQLAELFGRDKSVISRHLKNIFSDEELDKSSVVAYFATTAADGKTYNVEYYNLDAILSVGYRVNSKQGTQFRRWASNVLKDHLIKGYSLNQQRLFEGKIKELQQAIELMSSTLETHGLLDETGKQILNIVQGYAKTWDVLVKYDENELLIPESLHKIETEVFNYELAKEAISEFKKKFTNHTMFGIEREHLFQAILGNLAQTFGGAPLYSSIEERAAHLIYFVIKDHPFSDGNKRIGSFLFLLYLRNAGINIEYVNQNTLIALALLVAESDPSQKEIIIKLILNILSK